MDFITGVAEFEKQIQEIGKKVIEAFFSCSPFVLLAIQILSQFKGWPDLGWGPVQLHPVDERRIYCVRAQELRGSPSPRSMRRSKSGPSTKRRREEEEGREWSGRGDGIVFLLPTRLSGRHAGSDGGWRFRSSKFFLHFSSLRTTPIDFPRR